MELPQSWAKTLIYLLALCYAGNISSHFISVAWCKTVVSPLLTQWRYYRLAPKNWYDITEGTIPCCDVMLCQYHLYLDIFHVFHVFLYFFLSCFVWDIYVYLNLLISFVLTIIVFASRKKYKYLQIYILFDARKIYEEVNVLAMLYSLENSQ